MEQVYMTFDLDGMPYEVTATPCLYNGETQYQVAVNGNDTVLFIFDRDLGRYAAEGNASINVPEYVDMEIGNELNRIAPRK